MDGYFWLEKGVNACGVNGDVSQVSIDKFEDPDL